MPAHKRFLVRARSVNEVRRAFGVSPPGGVRVVGRYDRDRIECRHTMDESSYAKLWPILDSRLAKAGLRAEVIADAEPPLAATLEQTKPIPDSGHPKG